MSEHAYTREHLPWFVTGTLEEHDARRVAAHLESCEACRGELAQEHAVADTIGATQVVDLAPQASFAKLMARIEARESRRARIARWLRPFAGERGHRPLVFTTAVQAAVIVMLTGVLAAVLLRGEDPPANYRTLSNAPPAAIAHGPQLRVVADDALTLSALRELLAPLGARIVDGPGTSGILTIEVSGASADEALRTLRAQPGVRLAEIVSE